MVGLTKKVGKLTSKGTKAEALYLEATAFQKKGNKCKEPELGMEFLWEESKANSWSRVLEESQR